MEPKDLIKRVRMRGIDDGEAGDELLVEYIATISDRLCLRLGVEALPKLFESICVDSVVKMHRRVFYEGISSEGAANITTSFVDDILSEYADEIGRYLERMANTGNSEKVVHFL